MAESRPLISICVCTYKRPTLLGELLTSLASQTLKNFEIIVVDNDHRSSGKVIIEKFRALHSLVATHYAVEPQQGISYARNRTVSMASGEYIAFIDDDEIAHPNWLQDHYNCLVATNADATLGPVVPIFPSSSKPWAIKSKLFERPRHKSQSRVDSGDGRTGNAFIKAHWCKNRTPSCFKTSLAQSGGEDHDFFEWVVSLGGVLVWSDSAIVSEAVPLERQSVTFILERQFRSSVTYWRGENTLRGQLSKSIEACKGALGGAVFVLLGLLVLPAGLAHALKCWVKAANGFGRVAALSKVQLVGYGVKDE